MLATSNIFLNKKQRNFPIIGQNKLKPDFSPVYPSFNKINKPCSATFGNNLDYVLGQNNSFRTVNKKPDSPDYERYFDAETDVEKITLPKFTVMSQDEDGIEWYDEKGNYFFGEVAEWNDLFDGSLGEQENTDTSNNYMEVIDYSSGKIRTIDLP